MSMFPQGGVQPLEYGYAETGERSRLLTRFFHTVYLWMAIGLCWTALVSWACVNIAGLQVFMSPGAIMFAGIAAFIVSIATQSLAMRMNMGVGLALFMLYATLIGVAIAPIWLIYNQNTIGVAFLLTGGIFAVMSVIGFVTKMDLSGLRSILIMAVWGLLLATVVNFFMASSMMSWFVTYAVVIIFPLLIATQTQMLKEFALEHGENGTLAGRMAVVGALQLYIAFINIFLALLRILGDRR